MVFQAIMSAISRKSGQFWPKLGGNQVNLGQKVGKRGKFLSFPNDFTKFN